MEFLPGLVEQRDQAVVEQVEEIPQRGVARADALIDQFAVGARQDALRAVQPQKFTRISGGCAVAQFQRLDLAGRKRHVRVGGEAHHFGGRVAEPAHHLAFAAAIRAISRIAWKNSNR